MKCDNKLCENRFDDPECPRDDGDCISPRNENEDYVEICKIKIAWSASKEKLSAINDQNELVTLLSGMIDAFGSHREDAWFRLNYNRIRAVLSDYEICHCPSGYGGTILRPGISNGKCVSCGKPGKYPPHDNAQHRVDFECSLIPLLCDIKLYLNEPDRYTDKLEHIHKRLDAILAQ